MNKDDLPELPPLPTTRKYKVGFGPGDIADMLSTEEVHAYAQEYGALCYEAASSDKNAEGLAKEWKIRYEGQIVLFEGAKLLNEAYSDVLRGLCSWLAVGGFNSEGLISPEIADQKIRWGVDHLVEASNAATLRAQPQAQDAGVRESEYPLYYMRDNHTFRRLSYDVEFALTELRIEIDEGWTGGMLCSKREGDPPSVSYEHRDGEKFWPAAREWLEKCLQARAALKQSLAQPSKSRIPDMSAEWCAKMAKLEEGVEDFAADGQQPAQALPQHAQVLELLDQLMHYVPAKDIMLRDDAEFADLWEACNTTLAQPAQEPHGCQRIYPPDFPSMPKTATTASMSRKDLWDYACLTGWRTGHFAEQQPAQAAVLEGFRPSVCESDQLRIDWCIRTLHDCYKSLGRDTPLGDFYPEIISVVGALKRVLEPIKVDAVPEGWKLVPRKISDEMAAAMVTAIFKGDQAVWDAALNAAPDSGEG